MDDDKFIVISRSPVSLGSISCQECYLAARTLTFVDKIALGYCLSRTIESLRYIQLTQNTLAHTIGINCHLLSLFGIIVTVT